MPQACRPDKLEYSEAMKKFGFWLTLVILGLALTGCQSQHSGSREYIPGKGWMHND